MAGDGESPLAFLTPGEFAAAARAAAARRLPRRGPIRGPIRAIRAATTART